MASITYSPIWKDVNYTSTASSVVYRIQLDGNVIYSGRAVKYPGEQYLKININKICRNYLESDIATLLSTLPSTLTRENHIYGQKLFNLYVNNVNVQDYMFYQDYSYNTDKAVQGSVNVSSPINGHYVPGMMRLRTTRVTSSTPTLYTEGYVAGTDDTNLLGYTKQVKCTPYVLYYLNSYGGWDAFVIEGNTVKKDDYTTYTTDQSFDNTTLEFEHNKYVQEIKTTYELNTNFLSDEQAANLAKNLIGSVKVYLHNIDEGWVKPVLISDNAATYQTYATNGRKLCQYKITVKESQTKIRK